MEGGAGRFAERRASVAFVRSPSCSRSGVVAAVLLISCTPAASPTSVGPAGGLVASDDDAFTLVLWPGALGEFHDFEIVQTEDAPESFGQAYRVTPNVALGVDAEIILRGELPDPTSLARVGAIAPGDAEGGAWKALPLEPNGVNANDDTVRGHDDAIALYYAMLDDGSDPGTTSDTMETSSDSGDPTGPPLSFAADVQPIFDANCTAPPSCHGASPSGMLSLDMDAYENIVGVQAFINGSLMRVVAGDPDNSLLMLKVDIDLVAGQGGPMPPGGQLPEATRDTIRSWIDQGCPP